MRRIFIYTIFLGMAILILWGSPERILSLFGGKTDGDEKLAQARVSLGYVLKGDERWTSFPLNPEINRIRLLTMASVQSRAMDPEKEYWYALEYQLMNRDRKPIAKETLNFSAKVTLYQDQAGGKARPVKFYLDDKFVPSDMRLKLLNLAEFGQASFLRCRLAGNDPLVRDVIFRAYFEEAVPPSRAAYLWHRLNEKEKEDLARASVYPPELLSEQEKFHLLSTQWRPLGPTGVEGKDYVSRRVYTLDRRILEKVSEPVIPEGFFLHENHRGIIPIPEMGGELRLSFSPGPEAAPDTRERILIRKFDYETGMDWEETLSFQEAIKKGFEKTVSSGLLELETGAGVILKATLKNSGQDLDITPQPPRVRAYRVEAQNPLLLDIRHMENSPTPLRLDIRYPIGQGGGEKPKPVRYYLLDETGKTVTSGTLDDLIEPSLYDRVLGDTTGMMVSEAVKWYFSIEPRMVRVRLECEDPVLITAYNRPPDMMKKTRVPQDYEKRALRDEERQPFWFAFNPVDHETLLSGERVIIIETQYRPPLEKIDLSLEEYNWESFFPGGSWQGRYLLVPADPAGPMRKEKLPAVYKKLPRDSETALNFPQYAFGISSVAPTVIYLRKDAKPEVIEIYIDGGPVLKSNITGTRGEIQLPPISIGMHKIRARFSAKSKLYINHAGQGPDAFVKRFANRLGAKGLQFIYTKKSAEEQVLMVHFFPGAKYDQAVFINAEIKTGGRESRQPLPERTHLKRRFLLSPADGAPVPVFNTKNEYADPGQLFFLPLGSDLPPGNYLIRFVAEKGVTGYLIFSQITLGVSEKRSVFRERFIADD